MSAAQDAPQGEGRELARGLGLWDTSLMVLGLVIGGGIFLTPASIAKAVPGRDAGSSASGSWAASSSIAGGLVYAEMGAMMPKAGGMYVFFREAFGELPAFLYAWVAFWVILIGSDAAVAVGFAQYFSVFFPSPLERQRPLRARALRDQRGPARRRRPRRASFPASHYVGVREGARIQGVFTSMIVLALLWIAVGGAFASASRPAAPPAALTPAAAISFAGIGTALVAIFWTLLRLERDRGRRGRSRQPPPQPAPRAHRRDGASSRCSMSPSTPSSSRRSRPSEMAGVGEPAALAATRLFGGNAAFLIALAITAAAAGCTSAGIAPGPRIVYALAKDGLFPAPFGRVHPRFQTPSFAIVVQAVWMSLLCLSGRYDQLYTYATFFVILAYAATGISLFVMRRKQPGPRRARTAAGAIPSCRCSSSSSRSRSPPTRCASNRRRRWRASAILLLGLPVYFRMRRRLRKTAA